MLLKRLSSKTISLLLVVALAINLCACASTEAGDGDQAIDSETVTNINEEELASELMQDDDSASKSKGKIYKIWTFSEWTSLQK